MFVHILLHILGKYWQLGCGMDVRTDKSTSISLSSSHESTGVKEISMGISYLFSLVANFYWITSAKTSKT